MMHAKGQGEGNCPLELTTKKELQNYLLSIMMKVVLQDTT